MQLPTLWLTFSFAKVASRCKTKNNMQKMQLLAKPETMQKNANCILSPPPADQKLIAIAWHL
jgi:hypothetical protein